MITNNTLWWTEHWQCLIHWACNTGLLVLISNPHTEIYSLISKNKAFCTSNFVLPIFGSSLMISQTILNKWNLHKMSRRFESLQISVFNGSQSKKNAYGMFILTFVDI